MSAATSRRVPRVLSIAGTDPSGGAGIQADLKSIAAVGGYGMSAVTALVAQNTRGVRSVHVPPAAFLAEQLDAVSDDVAIDAVKIGMLANAGIIRTVGDWLQRVKPPVVVLDPVMIATSGDRLLDADAEAALRELLPLAHLITPNLHEQAVLAGEPRAATWTEALAQAERLSASLGVLVLAKGGHLGGTAAPDALVDSTNSGAAAPRIIEFPGERIETTNTHGTGCSLSSAIATLRADLGSWEAAVIEARRWLRESITHGASLEVGEGHGPVSHFAGLWERGGLTTAPSPGEVEAEWWAGIADVRDAIDALGFVRGLADGSLDRPPFLRYLAQDALYLRDYSRVLAVASSSATDAAEQAFWAASARGAIIGELELHASWLPEGEAFAAEPDAATTGYLNHLLATAARGDYPVLAAALLPCFWIYVDLGERLAAGAFGPQALAPGHPYASWLETYADPTFAVATREAIGIVTRLAAAADRPTREAMWRAFRASSEHELAFFASPLGEQGASMPAMTAATAHTANPQLRSDIRGTVHEPAVFS